MLVQLVRVFEGEAGDGGKPRDQDLAIPPMSGLEFARDEAFLVAQFDISNEQAPWPQQASDFAQHPLQVEYMVQSIGVDRIDRPVREDDVVEISWQDVVIVGSRLEIDTDREVTKSVQGPDLGAEPRSEAQHRSRLSQRLAALEAGQEYGELLFLGSAQPIDDAIELGSLVTKVGIVRGIVPPRELLVVRPPARLAKSLQTGARLERLLTLARLWADAVLRKPA